MVGRMGEAARKGASKGDCKGDCKVCMQGLHARRGGEQVSILLVLFKQPVYCGNTYVKLAGHSLYVVVMLP